MSQGPAGNSTTPVWHVQGTTTLYLVDERHHSIQTLSPQQQSPAAAASAATRQLALHLRASCHVNKVMIHSLNEQGTALLPLATSYFHSDPLQHVLIKPPSSFALDDYISSNNPNNSSSSNATTTRRRRTTYEYKFDADAQSSRGAVGMTTALRASSMASNMGELRISVQAPPLLLPAVVTAANMTRETKDAPQEGGGGNSNNNNIATVWKQELEAHNSNDETDGKVARALTVELRERAGDRRRKRLDRIVERLAEASITSSALRVQINYTIPLESSQIHHLAGFHALTTNQSPHMYTTPGVYGDHEGPRSWLPCLDSAATSHRHSHEIMIRVTAPMRQGLSAVAFGEDFGRQWTLLHDDPGTVGTWNGTATREQLGVAHVDLLERIARTQYSQDDWMMDDAASSSHVIPPDSTSTLDAIQATVTWTSASWTPIPVRSVGFAVGPWKVLEDPEYFGPSAVGDEDDDDDDDEDQGPSFEEKHELFLEAARSNGEGIRQVYFAPLFERKYLHADADPVLLPNTRIHMAPLTAKQYETAAEFDQLVNMCTVGVPHRALSLMRDILAVPYFRTSAYTQVWIPDAVNGGCTSGSFVNCPEVSLNPFLGGAILDSRLLPPVGCRLPYYQGGRVLQFVQARSAVRGWITAALPLGGYDDVGNAYIHSLTESFIISLYERGHGAQGEGKLDGVYVCQTYGTLLSLMIHFVRRCQGRRFLQQAVCSHEWPKQRQFRLSPCGKH